MLTSCNIDLDSEKTTATLFLPVLQSAVDCFSRAISLNPSEPIPWIDRSAAYLELSCPFLAFSDAKYVLDLLSSSSADDRGLRLQAQLLCAKAAEAMAWWEMADEMYISCLPRPGVPPPRGPRGFPVDLREITEAALHCRQSLLAERPQQTDSPMWFRRHLTEVTVSDLLGSSSSKTEKRWSTTRVKLGEQEGTTGIPETLYPERNSVNVLDRFKSCNKALIQLGVSKQPGCGIGIFATVNIRKGTQLLTEQALLAVTDLDDRCHHCLRKFGKNISPVPCRGICGKQFCSPECEATAHEQYHAILCDSSLSLNMQWLGMSGNAVSDKLPLIAWKMIGLALLQSHGRGGFDASPSEIPPFCQLCHIVETDPSFIGMCYTQWAAIKDGLGEPLSHDPKFTLIWYAKLAAMLLGNCVELSDKNHAPSGVALLRQGSFFNHSCDPNAEMTSNTDSNGSQISVSALRTIQAGEEITLSYLPNIRKINTFAERQSELLSKRFFRCNCSKCMDDSRK